MVLALCVEPQLKCFGRKTKQLQGHIVTDVVTRVTCSQPPAGLNPKAPQGDRIARRGVAWSQMMSSWHGMRNTTKQMTPTNRGICSRCVMMNVTKRVLTHGSPSCVVQHVDCVILDDGGFLLMSNQEDYITQVRRHQPAHSLGVVVLNHSMKLVIWWNHVETTCGIHGLWKVHPCTPDRFIKKKKKSSYFICTVVYGKTSYRGCSSVGKAVLNFVIGILQ